jgi:hypothetical protein
MFVTVLTENRIDCKRIYPGLPVCIELLLVGSSVLNA